LVTSDRGLCGSYNHGLLRDFLSRYQSESKQGQKINVLCVGRRGYLLCKKTGVIVSKFVAQPAAHLTAVLARQVAAEAADAFVKGAAQKVLLCYNKFVNMVRYDRVFDALFPLMAVDVSSGRGIRPDAPTSNANWIIEPDPMTVLSALLPYHVESSVYQVLLSANAAEHAARMLAMSSATDNASDMIKHLNLSYNKARQAAITKEILEVVGGARALKRK
jgi:F-type H+-transporting ATPase subunit gamma